MRGAVPLCMLIVLSLAAPVLAQSRVEGVVRSADAGPLAGVAVRLEAPEYKQPLTTTTTADGHYTFVDVRAGIRAHVVAVQAGRVVAEAFPLLTMFVETVDLRVPARPVPVTVTTAEDVLATEGPFGELAGIVSTDDGRPLVAAQVTIGDDAVSAVTDAAGRYVFSELRPGIRVRMHASAAGFRPATTDADVSAGRHAPVDFALAAAPANRTIRAELSTLPASAEGSLVTARPDDITGIPTLGRRDVFRALQFLPGVAGGLASSADLYVRGGTPDQTLVRSDGFTLYQFGDTFGALSAYNMDTVDSATFSKSTFDAADGGRLSGALRLAGRSNTTGTPTGFVDLSGLGGSALVDVPIGDRGSVMFAARQSPPASLYDAVLDAFGPTGGTTERDRMPRFSGGLFPGAPTTSSFRDVNARIEMKVDARDRVAVAVYDGRNDANNSRDWMLPQLGGGVDVVQSPSLPGDALVQVSDAQRWTAQGRSGTWTRQWSASASTAVVVARSDYSRDSDRAWVAASPASGTDLSSAFGGGGSSGLSDSNHVRETTVRVENSAAVRFAHALTFGAEVSSLAVDYGVQGEILQPVGGGTFTSQLAGLIAQTASARVLTAYAQDAWRPAARVIVSPGLRITHADLAGATVFDPRVNGSYQLTPQLQLEAGWAVDHQFVNRITREDLLHGDGGFWALSDGTFVPVPRVRQLVAGGSWTAEGLVVDVEGYYKTFDNLTMLAPRLPPGGPLSAGTSYLYHGSGTSRGIEMLVQKATAWDTLWVAYTLSQADNRYPALEANPFPASYDQTHEFKVTDSVRLGRWPSLSAAWVVASGRPYTPANGTGTFWYPSGLAITQPTFDAKNSARLPTYHRLDLSTERDVSVHGVKASLGATLFNVYNQQNILSYEWEAIGNLLSQNPVTLMGRAANVYVRVGF